MNPSCSVGTVNLWERKVLNRVWKIIHLHMIWLKIDFKMLLASYFDNFVLISVVCPCSGEIMNVLFSVDDSLINEMIQSSSILCLCRSKKWARAKLSPLAGFQTLRSGRFWVQCGGAGTKRAASSLLTRIISVKSSTRGPIWKTMLINVRHCGYPSPHCPVTKCLLHCRWSEVNKLVWLGDACQ